MSGLTAIFETEATNPLEVGDAAPFFYGVATDGIFYSFMAQAGRPLAMVLARDLTDPALTAWLEAFIGLKEAFDVIGADLVITSDAAPNDVFAFAQQLGGAVKVVACEPSVYARCGFNRLGLGALALDRNARVAGRYKGVSPGDAAVSMFSALSGLPRDAPSGLIMQPAPVIVLPNLISADLCWSLIKAFESENHFDSGFAGVDAAGQPVYKLDYAKKKREDLMIGEEHPLYAQLTALLIARCQPEIKKAFHISIAHFDRILVARYDVGGHFARHRDNGGANVAFRQFALSVNLNVGEYDGGELFFPEFNDHPHAPPTGGGLIFSGSLIHEARPVTRGSRYALLTFLHDESAEAKRRAYEL